MSTDPTRIWRTGERVRITTGGRTVDGTVILASPNGRSLALGFEALLSPMGGLGGYAGMMPVMWNEGAFRDLIQGAPVALDEVQQ